MHVGYIHSENYGERKSEVQPTRSYTVFKTTWSEFIILTINFNFNNPKL
jgi:hypothetical protein